MPQSPFLPSKFADYARIGRPILTITSPESPIRDYMDRYGGGLAVTHTASEIAEAIRVLFTDQVWIDRQERPLTNELASCFTPETVAGEYTKMFHSLASDNSRR